MSNYKVKIKINDFFPKIDAIPYDDFICLISCNNYYSRIKLTEYETQQFKFDLKIIKNTDLLFNIKLINYLDNYKLVGMYNLIIPHIKVNQILQRDISLYKQQVKLIMNSNIKIKLFGIMMNITNIYLDLIFQISSMKGNPFVNHNQINKMKIYEMLGNNSYAKNYSKNKKKTKTSNNSMTDAKRNININLSKSPNVHYNNYIYDLKDNELPNGKKYTNINNKNYNNIGNQKYSDINFNVMNYNYLNYLKIDNNNNDNNYVSNVKFNINNRSPIIISKNVSDFIEQENNNKNIKQNKSTTNFNLNKKNKINDSPNKKVKSKESNYLNYQNISTKKKGKNKDNAQCYIDPFIIPNNLNDLHYAEMTNNSKNTHPKFLTESKNSMNFDNIINTHEKTEANQFMSNPKYQNLIKNNKNHKISNINNINKNQNILYDKKNRFNKFICNNKTEEKKKSANKNIKINQDKEIVKTHVFRNKINFSEFNENKTDNNNNKTPRDINKVNLNKDTINNTPIIFNVSKNEKQENDNIVIDLNNIENINNLDELDKNVKDKKEENKNQNIQKEIKELKDIQNKENIEIKKDEDIINPEEIKNKIIKSLEESLHIKKEIFSQIKKNQEYVNKLLLIKEKFYSELKLRNRLNETTNNLNMKTIIHVNIRGKLNSSPYLSMKKIKSKESSILYKIFYEHKNSPQYKALEAKKKLKEKMEQQKKVHSLLNIIRELIKTYENLSQLYNDDEKKKILFKSLLVRYGIREKEESKENKLMDKFNEIKQKLEEEKKINLMKVKKREMQEDLYKNVIKEEEDEERSSISEHQFFNRKSSIRNRISWCSDDSYNKEKDNFESNKSNNDERSNSLMSSGLKKIKERNDEDLSKNIDKENNEEDKKEDEIISDKINEGDNKQNKDNNVEEEKE